MERDPYDLLGIVRTATEAEIRAAYGRLSLVFQPMRWRNAPSAVRLQAIQWSQTLDEALQDALRTTAAARPAGMSGARASRQ